VFEAPSGSDGVSPHHDRQRFKAGGPPAERTSGAADQVVLADRWYRRSTELVAAQPALSSTLIHDLLVVEGFDGSYVTVARAVRAIRGPRFKARAVSVPIETARAL
jgi:hypothetical protein